MQKFVTFGEYNVTQHSDAQSKIATSVPFLAILVAPLGVAGQNIGLGLAMLMFIIFSIRDGGKSLRLSLSTPFTRYYLILWALIIVSIMFATVARGDSKEASRFFFGYTFACSMVVAGVSLRGQALRRNLLLNLVTILFALMAIVAVSQFLLGWKLEGIQIVGQTHRAQGFYSHPLTFAYSVIVLVPWSLARAMGRPKEWQSWVLATSAIIIVATSQSITVIVLAAFTCLLLGIKLLQKKTFLMTGVLCALCFLAVITVPNPIASKFQSVLSGQRGDHETSYPDDRIAFWHAHWEMFKDAPITGHGAGLESSDRKPFYEKIGLGQIKRMYEAHNMYLQYAVEGGIVPPLALLGFIVLWVLTIKKYLSTEKWHQLALVITPIIFAASGITQNAVQDSEVRYMLLLMCAASMWFIADCVDSVT